MCYRYGNNGIEFTKGLEMSALNHRVRSFFLLVFVYQPSILAFDNIQKTNHWKSIHIMNLPLQKRSKATEVDAINHKQIADLSEEELRCRYRAKIKV